MLGPEHTAYLVAALNPPGVCARGLSGVLLKAVQSPTPVPLFVAQRSEEVIKGTFFPDLANCINIESMRATLTVSQSCRLATWCLSNLCSRTASQDDVCAAISCCDFIGSYRGRSTVCRSSILSSNTHMHCDAKGHEPTSCEAKGHLVGLCEVCRDSAYCIKQPSVPMRLERALSSCQPSQIRYEVRVKLLVCICRDGARCLSSTAAL